MLVRPYRAADSFQLLLLDAAVAEEALARGSQPCSYAGHLRSFASRKDAALFVAEVDGRACGFAGVEVLRGTCYLYWLAVEAAYRRKGAGSALVRATMEYARRWGLPLMLHVHVANDVAQHMYVREGWRFEETAQGPRRWSDVPCVGEYSYSMEWCPEEELAAQPAGGISRCGEITEDFAACDSAAALSPRRKRRRITPVPQQADRPAAVA